MLQGTNNNLGPHPGGQKTPEHRLVMATRKRRTRYGRERVPVVADRLNAAIRLRGLSVNGLAKAAGIQQATVDLVVRGVSRKTQEDRLARIADVLQVPFEWLTGEWRLLPHAFYPKDVVDGQKEPTLPSLEQLVEHDFNSRCAGAVARDWPKDDQAWLLEAVLQTLIAPGSWRHLLVRSRPNPTPRVRRRPSAEEVSRLNQEAAERERQAMMCLSKAFQIILGPWLKGDAALDVRALQRLKNRQTSPSRTPEPKEQR